MNMNNANNKPNIQLSSGRIIRHEKQTNGSWFAIPTTGPMAITGSEWKEYEKLISATKPLLPEWLSEMIKN